MNRSSTIPTRVRAAAARAWQRIPRPVRTFGVPVGLVLVGIWLGNILFSETHEVPSDAEIMAADGDAIEFWTCAMHPQVRADAPGSCPICGMDLIPVSAEEGGAGMESVRISEAAAALMQIQVRPVERRAVVGEVQLNGRIDYDERQVHDVILRTEGQVERLYVNYVNASVGRGQRVAEIYSPAILTASQELLQTQRAAQRGGMPELVEAVKNQLQLLGVSQAQIDRIIETGEPARTYTIYAPAGGIVTELTARQGDWLGSGARVMQLGGTSQLWAQFEAYETDLGKLRQGQQVRFTVDAYPGRAFDGPITFIDPVVDGSRRTARVRVQVPNTGGILKPGMLARGRVSATQAAAESPLVIPASAPLLTGTRALVYVQVPDAPRPTFEPREVSLGSRTGGFVEVLSGLEEGELVVVHGAFRLDSELQIRGGRSMMNPEAARAVAAHDHGVAAGPEDRQEMTAEIDLRETVAAYLALTGALAGDDASGARAAAARMDRTLRALDADDPSWRRLRGRMTGPLGAMRADGAGIETLREQLQPLSTALEAAAGASGYDGTLKRAFCPMAFNNSGGTWLQREGDIANPYFGQRMLACGEIEYELTG
jgi:membrane fusion protein, copper/silver efflux system